MGVFHVFFNCTNDTKSRKASHMIFAQTLQISTILLSKKVAEKYKTLYKTQITVPKINVSPVRSGSP